MLIKFFRSSFLIHYLAYLLIGILLWVRAFISPPPMPEPLTEFTPFYHLLFSWFQNIPLPATILAFFIVVIEGIMLNMILSEHDVVPRNTFLPGLFYLVFMSSVPAALTIYPALLASVLFLPMIHILYGLYLKEDTLKDYLTIGMLAGFSMLFYLKSVFFLPVILMALMVYRDTHWRNWVVPLVGFFLPILYLFTYYFWTDRYQEAMTGWTEYFFGFFAFDIGGKYTELIIYGYIVLFFVLPALIRTVIGMNTHTIHLRRLLSLTIWFLLFTGLAVFTKGDPFLNTLLWLPAVALVTHNISEMKKPVLQDILFLLLLLAAAFSNFVP